MHAHRRFRTCNSKGAQPVTGGLHRFGAWRKVLVAPLRGSQQMGLCLQFHKIEILLLSA
jgi:hypothetical protein